ncbi:MAG: ABC transporter substrate-binding protein [bacterium]|nr:ABC transporter substrate-binding protein [bacterium]
MGRGRSGHAAGLLGMLATVAVAAGSGPQSTVEKLNAGMQQTLAKAESLGYQGRYDALAPLLASTFDLGLMAEKSLGRYWAPLSDADKARWKTTFADFMTATYAANLDHAGGQTFTILGEEPSSHGTVLVRTRIDEPGKDPVELAYRLQETDGTWRIADVFYRGTVSELALRRSDYSAALARGDLDALVATLRGKIADLAAGRGERQRPQ